MEPSQCGREMPTLVERRIQNELYCTPRFVCPHNEGLDDYNVCQYAVEVVQVFKGTHEVIKYEKKRLYICGTVSWASTGPKIIATQLLQSDE